MVQLHTPPMPSTTTLHHTAAAPSWLEIDLARLEANVRTLRGVLTAGASGSGAHPHAVAAADETDEPAGELPEDASVQSQHQPPAPGPQHSASSRAPLLCGVIKKDAYGLGASTIAHRLTKAGCDMLAVFSPEEAEQLIRNSVNAPMLLLMPMRTIGRTDALYRQAVAGKLHLTIHDVDQLHQLNEVGRTFGMRLPVHLYVDTGMSRSGLNEQQLQSVLAALPTLRTIRLAGLCSHLASADDDPRFTEEQRQRFDAILEEARPTLPADAPVTLPIPLARCATHACTLTWCAVVSACLAMGPRS